MLRAMAALVAARSGFAARRAASSGDVGLAGRAPLVVVASRACAPPSPAARVRAAHRAFSSLPPQRARVACAAHVARARAIPRRHGAGTHPRAAASRGGGAPRAPRGAAAIAAVRARLGARRFVALAARSGDDSAPVAAAAAAATTTRPPPDPPRPDRPTRNPLPPTPPPPPPTSRRHRTTRARARRSPRTTPSSSPGTASSSTACRSCSAPSTGGATARATLF